MRKTLIAALAAALTLAASTAFADVIHLAARRGDLKTVRAMVEMDPENAGLRDVQGWTPLHHAARGGHPEVCAFLIDRGARVDADAVGGTPLHLADNSATAELLMERGANIEARESAVGDSPLHSQALFGRTEVCRTLIDAGADVTARNKLGLTPLHHAAAAGHLEVIELLLQKGADVNARDEQGWTPLHWAAGIDRRQAVKMLAKSGADLNPADKLLGATPLHWAAGLGKKNMVTLLLDLGADANPRNKDGKTPLKIAREMNYPAIAKIIEERGGVE